MKTLIVGGDFTLTKGKESGVIRKLGESLSKSLKDSPTVVNGGRYDYEFTKAHKIAEDYDLILWMPNISNKEAKEYPNKKQGSILICSKLLHDDVTEVDAISRIFEMRGNAVIAISDNNGKWDFKLIDALGNVWADTLDIPTLADAIQKFVKWSNGQVRLPTTQWTHPDVEELIRINTKVADDFEKIKGRFFGNISTRCLKLFPSARLDNHYLVSRRNSRKDRLTSDDMVMVENTPLGISYHGVNKPSIDTPIQIKLYEFYPDINFMIHGHTYIHGAPYTQEYYPCGDLRELKAITKLGPYPAINLINHGFLIMARSIGHLKIITYEIPLIEREVGFETISCNP